MEWLNKYYLLESGTLFDRADLYRKEYQKKSQEMFDYIKSIGAKGYNTNITGYLAAVIFEKEAPDGFKKKDKWGINYPKVGSTWSKEFKRYQLPDVISWMQEVIHCPLSLNYTYNDIQAGTRVGHPFNPIGIYWIKDDWLLLLVTPDVEMHAKNIIRDCPDAKFSNNDDTYELLYQFEDGVREILKEEWNLMVAKHKKGIK